MPRVIVAGYAVRFPLGGYVWQVLHYVLGFQRLGCDVFFYEDNVHEAEAYDPVTGEFDDHYEYERGCGIVGDAFRGFGLEGRWAFHDRERDRHWGAGAEETRRRFAGADLYVNLGGVNRIAGLPRPRVAIYVDMDPGFSQINLDQGDAVLRELLEEHDLHFTFGENVGTARSAIPTGGLEWRPTRQVVVPELWENDAEPGPCFTTIGKWRNEHRDRSFGGTELGWSKEGEWTRFRALPERTGACFELAMDVSATDPAAAAALSAAGWRIRDPLGVSVDHRAYRDYVVGSRGELSVAKEMYVRLRSGWFSDRSACYLAAGRPVILQDTGFADVLPTGEGLFAMRDLEDAERAVGTVAADYERHSEAARRIARDWFAPEAVLRPILQSAGFADR
ncbi:MAG: hypothetical protein QOD06_1351 [Candidatus Binatota bacterium]|nr:hypothetical protein [Candidatus Binatota bacterium]